MEYEIKIKMTKNKTQPRFEVNILLYINNNL